jgi:hypothetical protein
MFPQQVCMRDYFGPLIGFQIGEPSRETIIKLYISFHWELLFQTPNIFPERNNANRNTPARPPLPGRYSPVTCHIWHQC